MNTFKINNGFLKLTGVTFCCVNQIDDAITRNSKPGINLLKVLCLFPVAYFANQMPAKPTAGMTPPDKKMISCCLDISELLAAMPKSGQTKVCSKKSLHEFDNAK